MIEKNKFEVIMDYIDNNIKQDVSEIKKGISKVSGYNSLAFGKCLLVLTNITLHHYICSRKLYFALKELRENSEKKMCDIAYDYGYSD